MDDSPDRRGPTDCGGDREIPTALRGAGATPDVAGNGGDQVTINFPGREGPMEAGAAFEDPYVLWDAAYVLGSLSSAERREFENHMSACPSCRAAVSELSGMPAL